MSSPPPLPYRISFLAPRLALPAGAEHLEQASALLLFIALFEHLLRHPRVTVTDPDDHRLVDNEDRLITIDHPNIDAIRGGEYGEGRRDELLWIEASLDQARPMPTKLKVERYDGRTREFAAIGSGPLGAQIENCIQQWLAQTELPPSPTRLEPFGADDFLNAAACGFEAIRTRGQDGSINMTVPPRLQVPFFRFIYVTTNTYTYQQILQLEPDNPWAIRDQFLAGIHNDGPTSRDPIRAAIKTAPMFGKPYLSMFGDEVSDDEKLASFAMASVLIPGNAFALKDYGYTLDQVARWSEAGRYAERASRAAPLMMEAHMLAMDAYDTCRYGELLNTGMQHIGFLDHLIEQEVLDPGDPDVRHVRLRFADTLMRCGRFDEAIEARAAALSGLEGSWPNQTKVLDRWRSDADLFAQLYAREGRHRGDPGRVIQGFSAARPDGAADLGMFIEALIELGREDFGALAYMQHSRTNTVINPVARLAGAKALALVGKTAEAIDAVQRVTVGFPHLGWETACNRVLRLLSGRPAAEWDAVVEKHLMAGAYRLARFVARDAADFVPGMAQSRAVVHALSGAKPFGYDQSIFAALRGSLAQYGIDGIDRLCDSFTQPTLEHADRIAHELPNLIPDAPEGDDHDAHLARAAKILWAFASSFGRYLALSTQPPNVLAGGYRQAASDALELLKSVRGVLPRGVIRQLFEGLERIAGVLDPWLLDSWLLRFERALDLEANEAGHLAPLTAGMPWMTWLVRGDERIGFEVKLAIDALADPGRAGEAVVLLERCVRAVGRGMAPKWSAAAAKALPPDRALDIHLTAAFAHQGYAGPAVEAARILMPQGRGAAAFEVLCSNLPGAGKQWRDTQVATLVPMWAQAQMPCPAAYEQAADTGLRAMQQGNMPLAVDCHRWMLALDPQNAQCWRNLGIAYAHLGRGHDSLAAFSRVDVAQGPQLAPQGLREAKHADQATLIARYASQWFGTADEWLGLATAAANGDDAETAGEAYSKVLALNPQAATTNMLHQLADALNEMGDHQRAAEVAQRLLEMARGDATYTTCGVYHLGTALLGMRRFQEAVPYLEQALAQNRFPENQQPYSQNLERARRGEPLTPKPSRFSAPGARTFARLADGDFQGVMQLTEDAAGAAGRLKLERAKLTAAEYRFESENDVLVTPRARAAAQAALTATAGQLDPDAALIRVQALRIRENASFPADMPCFLGRSVPRERFAQLFAERRTGAFQNAPVGAGPDPVVFPGQRIARLSDYVRLMKSMQGGNVMGALQAAGLDMNTYGQVAMGWGQRLSTDPQLAMAFQQMMQSS
jgi:tetratricopeptide (TPR) repeat protein